MPREVVYGQMGVCVCQCVLATAVLHVRGPPLVSAHTLYFLLRHGLLFATAFTKADWLLSFYQSLPPALSCHDGIPSTCCHGQIFMYSGEPKLKSSHLQGQPSCPDLLKAINWPMLTEFSYRQGSYPTVHLYTSIAR